MVLLQGPLLPAVPGPLKEKRWDKFRATPPSLLKIELEAVSEREACFHAEVLLAAPSVLAEACCPPSSNRSPKCMSNRFS